MKKLQSLSTYEKLKLWGLIIKSVFGTVGGAVILTQNHPYISIIILAIGAGANEYVSFLKDREASNGQN